MLIQIFMDLRNWFLAPDCPVDRAASHRQSLKIARVASGLVVLLGCLVLLGWSLNLAFLKSVIPGSVSMKANTALCFILAGVSLGLQTRTRRSATTSLATGCAVAVGAIGLLTSSQYGFGFNLGIDELLFRDTPLSPATSHPGRMGINTAINFVLTGAALWLYSQREKLRQRSHQQARFDRITMAQSLTAAAGLIALQAMVGYAYRVQVLHRVSSLTTSMAVHTAFAFILLCAGILALESDRGLMHTLTRRDSIGSDVARRFVPATIVVPLVLGWVFLQGQDSDAYDPNFALSLLSLSQIAVALGLIWLSAGTLDQLDQERKQSSERLRLSEERLQLALQGSKQGIWDWNLITGVLTWDDRCKEIFGLPPDVPVTWAWHLDALHPDDRQRVSHAAATALRDRAEFDEEYRIFQPNGTMRWVLARGQGYSDAAGEPCRMSGTVLDITERKHIEDARRIAELNDQFLNDLDSRLRQLSDADAMEWEVVSRLGEYLKVDRCLWHNVDLQADIITVEQDWRSQAEMPSIVGTYRLSEMMLPNIIHQYQQTSHPAVVRDVATCEHTAPFAQNYRGLGIHAFVAVPCVRAGRWVAHLTVNSAAVRSWRSDEVMLLQEVVVRLWPLIEQTRTMQALRDSEERLRLALRAANQGLYDLNVQTGDAIVSPEYALMLGYDPETFEETNARWRERLHPDDWEPVSRAYEEYIAGKQDEYRVEFRQRTVSGSWKWILSLGRIAAWDAEGNPLRMLGTHTDISDRKQAELEREELLAREQVARQEAERVNRLKDDFFSALSHELRTPLNPILGWTKMLQGRKLTPEKVAHALETIERNVRHQIHLVDDLLDVSRVIQGKLRLSFCPLDLTLILTDAIQTVEFAAQAKSVTLQFNPSEPIYTMGDVDRLGQVFWNLFSNAIKFTPEGGQVEIQLSVSQDGFSRFAQVCIADTGIGIAPDFLPHVFEYFRQAEGGSTRKYGGLGLGLAIVRHLVELHGGTITADSPGLGQGATFIVKLPLLNEGDRFEPTDFGRQAADDGDSHGSAAQAASPPDAIALFSGMTTSFGALAGVRIVLVDDEPDNLELLRFLLTHEGAIVTAFTSPSEALRHIAQSPPDLLISDIGMPELDGYEFIQQVRLLPSPQLQAISAEATLPKTEAALLPKAIALTAFAQPSDEQRILAAGFQAYLPKPIDRLQLIAAVKQILSQP
ncbi:PAS domain-containing protein [Leptolyngbya sp. FACHB-711]|uniref:PAS domain-containing protein n=1 Tax=Leptolyngbya sp. FACHB-711 TaxID=2692813 RepID=UPI0016866CEB|nr:PAS domain-containing protein [Leptolyngbya sp. FACHB-711]MBD2027908.1 PAS domain-containing protein [Leptolyngbya sp. FACHB-711]